MLTVDVPVAGARLRDVRNGFAIPPALTTKTVLDSATHPAWWVNLLTTRPLEFASLKAWEGTVAEMIDALFDPTMTIADLEWVRSCWDGPLVIKGIQTVDDARAWWTPARTRSCCPTTVAASSTGRRCRSRLLPDVAEAVGDRTEVMLDTGVMSGARHRGRARARRARACWSAAPTCTG